ncbi:hypothetical protein Cantr_06837 [Candida viswanathii]|uniref:RING-type domain-containing protein n=1 Tax=Candida viswanathii TaxID=5486 RepID=A0A367XX76_9ASCO|nr:hypothetical protein Cantr_06837 [Candida viswanathii]
MSQTASSLLLQTTLPSPTFPSPSSTNTNSNWGNWPSPTSSSTANGNGNNNSNSYSSQSIGTTPSAVLFFLALAVGVVIALLFIFFTIRYFIRVKYGVNLSGISRRNFYNYQGRRRQNSTDNNNNNSNDSDGGGGTNNSVVNEHTFAHIFTTTEVQDQLQYIREHHYLRGEIIDRRLNYGSESLAARRRRRRQRRRRRRGRFAKMKKLTIEEVELLFPQKTYSSWMNGGKQLDIEKRGGMLYEEETEESQAAANLINGNVHVTDERTGNNDRCGDEDDNSSLPTLYTANINTSAKIGSSTSNNDIEMKKLTSIVHVEHDEHDETDLADGTTTSAVTSNEKDHALDDQHSLHYDSGSCAICLEVIEDDDIVRGLICGHVFHAECLDPWLTKRRACCPMCKRDYLFKRDYHDPNRTNEENNNTNEENSGNSNNTDANNNNNDDNNNTNNNNENSDETTMMIH